MKPEPTLVVAEFSTSVERIRVKYRDLLAQHTVLCQQHHERQEQAAAIASDMHKLERQIEGLREDWRKLL